MSQTLDTVWEKRFDNYVLYLFEYGIKREGKRTLYEKLDEKLGLNIFLIKHS